MPFSIRIGDATFTKYVAAVIPQTANMVGFYDFQRAELTNFSLSGGASLTRTGTPAAGTFSRIVGPDIGYDTGIVEPSTATTFVALAKGKLTATGTLLVTAFSWPVTTPRNMSLGGAAGQTYWTAYTGGNAEAAGTSITIDTTKYYFIAARRDAVGTGVTTDLVVFTGGAPTVFTSPAETILAPANTTIKLGYNAGTTFGVGTNELVAAGIWQRKLTNANLQEVYNYFVSAYPTIPMA